MNVVFKHQGNSVLTVNATTAVTITYDDDEFYVNVAGTDKKIDELDCDSTSASEVLKVTADGTAHGAPWEIKTVTHAYDQNSLAGLPSGGATWEERATNKLLVSVTGPEIVGHDATWDFQGPSTPPHPIKVTIKRR